MNILCLDLDELLLGTNLLQKQLFCEWRKRHLLVCKVYYFDDEYNLLGRENMGLAFVGEYPALSVKVL